MSDHYDDTSASGFIVDTFEGVSSRFTDLEVLHTSDYNVTARASRYGRLWLLKGLATAVAHTEAYRQMLRKEFETMMTLNHPYVVQAVALEEVVPLGVCIVMEYVDGLTLAQWLEQRPTRRERRRVASEIIEGLAYIHSCGVVHRDIKPSNILITRMGATAKIIDFGLADGDANTILKQPAGTRRYMSPEQATEATADVRNDIYSLGAVLGDMGLGGAYRAVARRCMMPIARRYANIAELQQAIARGQRRRRRLWRSAAAVALVGALTAEWLLVRGSGDTSSAAKVDSLQSVVIASNEAIDATRRSMALVHDTVAQLRRAADSEAQRSAALNALIEQGRRELTRYWRSQIQQRIAAAKDYNEVSNLMSKFSDRYNAFLQAHAAELTAAEQVILEREMAKLYTDLSKQCTAKFDELSAQSVSQSSTMVAKTDSIRRAAALNDLIDKGRRQLSSYWERLRPRVEAATDFDEAVRVQSKLTDKLNAFVNGASPHLTDAELSVLKQELLTQHDQLIQSCTKKLNELTH
ncbi:MAG: serine/threonine-protein kinase [Muribaculaceae bacterium]